MSKHPLIEQWREAARKRGMFTRAAMHKCADDLDAYHAAHDLTPWAVYVHLEDCARCDMESDEPCTCGLAARLAAQEK